MAPGGELACEPFIHKHASPTVPTEPSPLRCCQTDSWAFFSLHKTVALEIAEVHIKLNHIHKAR